MEMNPTPMKMKSTLATLLVATAGALATPAVRAQEATPDDQFPVARSVLTRAEVRAEAIRARDAGETAALEQPGYLPVVAQSRPRAEVVAELNRARASGELSTLDAEAYDFGRAAMPTTMLAAHRIQVAGR
jgi:hypothetical protein